MTNTPKIEINFDGEHPTSNSRHLVVRTGEAMPLKEPIVFSVTGHIGNPLEFLKKHGVSLEKKVEVTAESVAAAKEKDCNHVSPTEAAVIVKRSARSISLFTNISSEYGHLVVGLLELSDELKAFKINEIGQMFKREDLVRLLRFTRRFFENKEIHQKIVDGFQRFSAIATQKTQEGSDTKGNRNSTFEQQVNSTIPNEFYLSMPIFKGFPPEKFLVTACADNSDGSWRFWFESVELADLIEAKTDKIIEEYTKGISLNYPVLYQ